MTTTEAPVDDFEGFDNITERDTRHASYLKRMMDLKTEHTKWLKQYNATFGEVSDDDEENEVVNENENNVQDQESSDFSDSGSERDARRGGRGGARAPKSENFESLLVRALTRLNSSTAEEIAHNMMKQLAARRPGPSDYTHESLTDVVRVMLRSNSKFMIDPHDDDRWVLADYYVDDEDDNMRTRRQRADILAQRKKARVEKTQPAAAKRGTSSGGCKQCGRGYGSSDKWIMCDQCKSWYCCDCAKVEDLSLYDDRNPNHLEFMCVTCENGGQPSDGAAGSSEDDFVGD